ncbi:MAG TPA: vitamin K epoxide reductase family protein [Candidatus Paceibacterota bacterium]|nr:vitamin K epoxide reductase family protein [Candidatus Paceibacterota bacterium]
MSKKTSTLIFIIIALAIVGLADTSYLTTKHYSEASIVCNIFDKCDIVTSSKYNNIAGVPISMIGVIYYLSIIFLVNLYLFLKKNLIIKIATSLSMIAFLFSVWLVYLQFFVLNAVCGYCMLSATVSTLIFVTIIFLSKISKAEFENKNFEKTLTE